MSSIRQCFKFRSIFNVKIFIPHIFLLVLKEYIIQTRSGPDVGWFPHFVFKCFWVVHWIPLHLFFRDDCEYLNADPRTLLAHPFNALVKIVRKRTGWVRPAEEQHTVDLSFGHDGLLDHVEECNLGLHRLIVGHERWFVIPAVVQQPLGCVLVEGYLAIFRWVKSDDEFIIIEF